MSTVKGYGDIIGDYGNANLENSSARLPATRADRRCLAMHDPQGRRGLWVATDCESAPDPDDCCPDDDVSCDVKGALEISEIALFAGREGGDAEVTLARDQLDARTFQNLLDVVGHARAAYREGERKGLGCGAGELDALRALADAVGGASAFSPTRDEWFQVLEALSVVRARARARRKE